MYPVTYAADFAEKRSRLSTFFRYFMLLPLFFVGFFWGVAVYVTLLCAWVALMVTGRYPQGLYDFHAKTLRFFTRVNAYANLMTDVYPPFGGQDAPSYPVRGAIGPPLAKYSRLKVFFRWIVGIPVWIMGYLYALLLGIVVLCSWVVIVVTGRQPQG